MPVQKRNIEKAPVWNSVVQRSVAFWTLCDQIHRYGGILKIHIIMKIYTIILCEPVYCPALNPLLFLF